jgi:hypothetical protein
MKRDDILRKVRHLLTRANHPATPEPERESCLVKATQLMDAYAIEQWEAAQAGEEKSSLKPERRQIDVEWWFKERYAIRSALWTVFRECSRLCRVVYNSGTIDYQTYELPVFGLGSDIDYMQMLYTDLFMQMSAKVKPKFDPNKSLGENVYNAKEAGMKYKHIAVWAGHPEWVTKKYRQSSGKYVTEVNGILIREMKKFAKQAGLEVHKEISLDAYIEDFCSAWATEVQRKLQTLRTGEPTETGSMALALRDITELAKELMWDEFPELRPHPPECDCDSCHAMKCSDPNCQRPRCVERRKPVKLSYAKTRYRELNYTALARGSKAGRDVNVPGKGGRGMGKTKEIDQ